MMTGEFPKNINPVKRFSRICKSCGVELPTNRGKYCLDCKVKILEKSTSFHAKKSLKKKRAELRRLADEADRLYQIKYISEKPNSIVSGEPTEVIHHFINKSKSNNLRYDDKNGIPLTNQEHNRHHLSGDPAIVITIKDKMGQEWFDDLQARRRIICKFNKEYLEGIIERLK